MKGLAHSKSMTDLREESNVTVGNTGSLRRSRSYGNLTTTTPSCNDLLKLVHYCNKTKYFLNHISFVVFRYIGGGGRYSMTCQNLIDKYSGDSRTSQTTNQGIVSSSNLSSRSGILIEDI